jgi:hypothetical protein
MKRIHPRLLTFLAFLGLVAASALGGHGKYWFP